MSDQAFGAVDGEAPVNPYSLVEAVNRASDTAHTAWLIFLAVMAYFVIAVAGVTHKDLLLDTAVELPLLQVKIPLIQFFQFAPIVLVLMHLGLVSQLALLARETLEFDRAVRLLETTPKRTHPLRLELNNFFFVQAIAGPHRSRVMGAFLHGISWLTLVILPVLLLLYFQITFLPYHDVATTWVHRVALIADILMLISIGVFLMRVETSFLQAFLRTSSSHPVSFIATILALAVVTVFSFFFATIPGETLDRITQQVIGSEAEDEVGEGRRYVAGFTIPFLDFGSEGSLLGIFLRNLVVTDTDLVVDRDQVEGEPSFSLRGRDLRFARLDRSDLHQVDLTGADLRGASLTGANLRGAWLQCADLSGLDTPAGRADAQCAIARRADFRRATLTRARMSGAVLSRANFEGAKLEEAELASARLGGANFTAARLDKADLSGGVQAQGAKFTIANLQGADLTGARLEGADLSSASLQGALLSGAQLPFAALKEADLEGASLALARLEGADLSGSRIVAADLRGAVVWMAKAPPADPTGTADFAGLVLQPASDALATELKQMVEAIRNRALRAELTQKIAAALETESAAAWSSSADAQVWQGYLAAAPAQVDVASAAPPAPATTSDVTAGALAATPAASPQPAPAYGDSRQRVTDHLVKLACKARWSNGAIATGLARRAVTRAFAGDLVAVHDRLKADDCPGGKLISAKALRDLAAAADIARAN